MSFLSSLSFDSLKRLRRVVKQVHMIHFPEAMVTDREADRIIDALGPAIMEDELRRAIEGGKVSF